MPEETMRGGSLPRQEDEEEEEEEEEVVVEGGKETEESVPSAHLWVRNGARLHGRVGVVGQKFKLNKKYKQKKPL